MPSVAAIIRENQREIMELWSKEALRVASARGLSKPEFDNIMPRFLSTLGEADDLGQFSPRRRKLIESHLSSRIRQGFDLAEIVEEFALLHRAVSYMWEKGTVEAPEAQDIQWLFVEFNAVTTAVAEIFRQHMSEAEQNDKRYTRLLQQIANEALAKGGQPFSERLEDVLTLIMEAMNAQATTLLLKNDPDSDTMRTVASVGDATGLLEKYVTTHAPMSFAGQVASNAYPTTVFDVLTTELQVSDLLKQHGIHSLLGVRLPPHGPTIGVLYVGLAETRDFSPRELQRIETLAARLTLHLNNARVYEELHQKVQALTLERELRERFMSVLAHDLRGPLNVVHMAARTLLSNPQKFETSRELLVKIGQNSTRIDRMIEDLLDVSRIHANERLPLRLDECNLSMLATDILEELHVVHPTRRFVLKKDEGVRGIWSAEELRRAIWNLAINATKYGDANEPITLSVIRSDFGAEVSVHNHGSVIRPEDQALLFKPFARSATKGQKGWGLGLTLVRGIAEAHGGKITIESSTEAGTTFTIHLPPDSRPYQPTSVE